MSDDQLPPAAAITSISLPGNIPPWAYAMMMLLGIPLTGAGSSFLGASQATAEMTRQAEQLTRLEDKVDDLDDSFDDLEKALIRLNPEIQLP